MKTHNGTENRKVRERTVCEVCSKNMYKESYRRHIEKFREKRTRLGRVTHMQPVPSMMYCISFQAATRGKTARDWCE